MISFAYTMNKLIYALNVKEGMLISKSDYFYESNYELKLTFSNQYYLKQVSKEYIKVSYQLC